uniref:Uncharacterized protein n=1 Tax=Oryza punctata TaxID=4537 RepID=A0A0E0MQ24_ORYPU
MHQAGVAKHNRSIHRSENFVGGGNAGGGGVPAAVVEHVEVGLASADVAPLMGDTLLERLIVGAARIHHWMSSSGRRRRGRRSGRGGVDDVHAQFTPASEQSNTHVDVEVSGGVAGTRAKATNACTLFAQPQESVVKAFERDGNFDEARLAHFSSAMEEWKRAKLH